MARTDPAAAAARWSQQMAGAGDRIKSGVQAVTVPPGQAAARQQSAYTAGVAANAGKWAQRVSAVSLPAWQQAMIDKGLQRIAGGASAAQSKVASFMTQFLPAVDAAVSSLPPRGSYEANKARLVQYLDKIHSFQYRPAGG